MLDILVRALSLISIIGIGLLAKQLGWVSTSDFPKFSKLVLYVTLPAAIASAFNNFEISVSLLGISLFAFGVLLIQQLLAFLMNIRASRQQQSTAVLSMGGFNIGAFATPYISGMMGPQAVVYTSMFDVGNALGIGGFGYSAAMFLAEERKPNVLAFFVRMFRNPAFTVYVGLLTMRMLDLSFPPEVMVLVDTVGAANPFMAMLMLGIGLELRIPRWKAAHAFQMLAVRYAVAAVFAVAAWFLSPFDALTRAAICALLFAPIPSQAPVLTAEARGDVQLSTFMVTISIMVGIVAMPLILAGLSG